MDKENTTVHAERLATLDEAGHRIYVHPEEVKGKWRDRRTLVFYALVSIYFVLPWIHFSGKQIILLDLAEREFTFFGTTFFSHDGPLVFFIFLSFVLAFGFITVKWGRIWCGWACPQTVFIDLVYRRIEKMIEGSARARKKLSAQPLNLNKFIKKSFKWFLFLLVSVHLSHTFLGYFVGTRKLFLVTIGNPTDHWTLFVIMWSVTLLFLFDFGWFREQFCIVACPYGKIQSVVMDEASLVVAYDVSRGEPRRKTVPSDQEGECISCDHCVKVCPTGIDIRKGTQLECISCTQCIDACDEIMTKMERPLGLIRYDSLSNMEGKKVSSFAAKPMFYAVALLVTFLAFGYALNKRNSISLQFIRGSKSAYQEIKRADGSREIVNHYKVSVYYNGDMDHNLTISTLENFKPEELRIVSQKMPFPVSPGKRQTVDIFIRFHKSILDHGRKTIKLQIKSDEQILEEEEVKLVGPF